MTDAGTAAHPVRTVRFPRSGTRREPLRSRSAITAPTTLHTVIADMHPCLCVAREGLSRGTEGGVLRPEDTGSSAQPAERYRVRAGARLPGMAVIEASVCVRVPDQHGRGNGQDPVIVQ